MPKHGGSRTEQDVARVMALFRSLDEARHRQPGPDQTSEPAEQEKPTPGVVHNLYRPLRPSEALRDSLTVLTSSILGWIGANQEYFPTSTRRILYLPTAATTGAFMAKYRGPDPSGDLEKYAASGAVPSTIRSDTTGYLTPPVIARFGAERPIFFSCGVSEAPDVDAETAALVAQPIISQHNTLFSSPRLMLLGIGGVATDSIAAIQLSLAMNRALAEQVAPLAATQAQFAPVQPASGLLYDEHIL